MLEKKDTFPFGAAAGRGLVAVLLFLILSACTDITGDYIPYSSLQDPLYGAPVWDGHQTAFTLKYPPDWEVTWVSESGIVAFLMASDDIEAVLSAEGHNNALVMIVVGNGFDSALEQNPDMKIESLLLNWVGGSDMIEAPHTLTINGHSAAQAIQNYNDEVQIVTIMMEGNADLLIFASAPEDQDETFRPVLEAILGTIELQSR